MKNKYKLMISYFILLSALISVSPGCSEDSGSEPETNDAAITGTVLFLDGGIGAMAQVELQNSSGNSRSYTNADENGVYKFENLSAGTYIVRFKSSSYNIFTFEAEVTVAENKTYEQNVYILYNMVDELKAQIVSEELVLIQFQPDGGRIGTNYEFVDYLSGMYFGDPTNLYTLSCEIYKNPADFDWSSIDSTFTPDYIRQNFELVTSVEETYFNAVHEIRFSEDDIPDILSNPPSGFVFVRASGDNRELKIPCVDFNNNDFGLRINYKQ